MGSSESAMRLHEEFQRESKARGRFVVSGAQKAQRRLTFRVAARYLRGMQVARKHGDRPKGTFYGDDSGTWKYTEGYPLGLRQEGWTWSASIALSSQNGWRNLSVDGATEHHNGFRKALYEIVSKYPEVGEWLISFDGPYLPVSQLVSVPKATEEPNWSQIAFFHGTSSHVLDTILREGLRPRSETNVDPAYGAEFGSAAGQREAVYLTTQEGMAKAAAISAARRKGDPIILRVVGLRPSLVAPDEDSRMDTALGSLQRIGSIAYLGAIPPKNISLLQRLAGGHWVKYARVAATDVWYHGSPKNFETFDLQFKHTFGKMPAFAPIFLTKDLRFAELHARGPEGRIYTVAASPRKVFDQDTLLKRPGARTKYWPPEEDDMSELGLELLTALDRGEIFGDVGERPDHVWAEIYRGDYDLMETSEMRAWLRSKGFDAFYVTGDGPRNLAVMDPTRLKILDSRPS